MEARAANDRLLGEHEPNECSRNQHPNRDGGTRRPEAVSGGTDSPSVSSSKACEARCGCVGE